jgi:hypothetical protein
MNRGVNEKLFLIQQSTHYGFSHFRRLAFWEMNMKFSSPNFLAKARASRTIFIALFLVALLLPACNKENKNQPEEKAPPPAPTVTVDEMFKRYRATEGYKTSEVKSRARITEADGSSQEVMLTVYRRRAPSGEQMLIQFVTPDQRDRSGLVLISPQGEIEGLRYAQSSDSFVSTKNSGGEDSLFGMSLQELADGQPEKYEFKLEGTEQADGRRSYKLDGRLKSGEESKFQRLVVFLAEDSFALAGAEFYYNETEMARRITVDKLEKTGQYWTRMKWAVDNVARQKKVEFETLSVKYDQNIPDAIFSRENLKKISVR